ncbi:MAG: U32 family peptidase [Rhodospirillales bacterium]|nr:U32 family peptidase [Rhodospirillales bacterium]
MKRSAATPKPGTKKRDPAAAKSPRAARAPSAITLGPLLHNWPAERRRDFYFRVADEAPVDSVCLGEVVCAKRAPFFEPYLDEVAERLIRGGKEVVFSTLALVTGARDMAFVAEAAARRGPIEANDIAAVELLRGKPHHVGPFVNVYSEDTAHLLGRLGATRICLPVELPAAAIGAMAKASPAEIEVVAFGRVPLAMSVRCFHARSRGLHKSNCRFVCGEDADGLPVETVEGERFLAIAGCHILSHAYVNLANEVAALRAAGVARFRLLPQAGDMIATAGIFRSLLDERIDGAEALAALRPLAPAETGFANGFVHGRAGEDWVAESLRA